MAKTEEESSFPELREYVMEHDGQLYNFCFLLVGDGVLAADLVVRIFKEFGSKYRKMASRKGGKWDPGEMHCLLFRLAWGRIRQASETLQFGISEARETGRDTREFHESDEDLLGRCSDLSDDKADWELLAGKISERLLYVDLDFRGPVVLRDILRLEDDEVMRILGVRWGVYRHRLHRGRLEFCDQLRGQQANRVVLQSSAELNG